MYLEESWNLSRSHALLTKQTAVVISGPPEAPATSLTRPFSSVKMTGEIEDCGLFPGLMKLLLEGSMPSGLSSPGVEKSAISLLYIIPVSMERYLHPKLEQRVQFEIYSVDVVNGASLGRSFESN